MMEWLRATALALGLGVICAAALADVTPVLRTSVSKTTVRVGDTLTYRVGVVAPERAAVSFEGPLPRLGAFETLRHITRPRVSLGAGNALWEEEYTLAVYNTGTQSVPPLWATVITPDGEQIAVTGDTLHVLVQSVLSEGDEELRDIKGLATRPAGALWPWITAAAAVAVAGVIVWLLMRRRRRLPALVRAAPPVAPEVAAIERLDALLRARLLEAGNFKRFYTELSDIVREYIHGRHLLAAQEMTTAELAEGMERIGLAGPFKGEICAILSESDMVKFAKFRPGIDAAFRTADRAKTLIERSAPRREEPAEAIAS